MKRWVLILSSVVASFVLASCYSEPDFFSMAPAFAEEPTIPNGQVLVYFYRQCQTYGSSTTPMILTNEDRPIVALAVCGYFPYFTNPGTLRFWTSKAFFLGAPPITVEAVAGQKYYVELDIKTGFWDSKWALTLVPPETAKTEIVRCHLVK